MDSMDIFVKIGAVLLLLIGALYPMGAIVRLASRLGQKGRPPLTALQLGLHFTLIAVVPLAGILGGFAGLMPSVWASTVLRIVIIGSAGAAAASLAILAWMSWAGRADARGE
jgi:hypothetical protein